MHTTFISIGNFSQFIHGYALKSLSLFAILGRCLRNVFFNGDNWVRVNRFYKFWLVSTEKKFDQLNRNLRFNIFHLGFCYRDYEFFLMQSFIFFSISFHLYFVCKP